MDGFKYWLLLFDVIYVELLLSVFCGVRCAELFRIRYTLSNLRLRFLSVVRTLRICQVWDLMVSLNDRKYYHMVMLCSYNYPKFMLCHLIVAIVTLKFNFCLI